MRDYLADFQYAAGMADGISAMSSSLNGVIHEKRSWTHAQVDVANAFSCVDRTEAYRTATQIHEDLAVCHHAWLCWDQHLLLPRAKHTAVLKQAAWGVPQGDPLSAWTFSLSIQRALNVFMADLSAMGWRRHEHYELHVYADDIVLSGETGLLPGMLEKLREALAHVHLTVQHAKLKVFSLGESEATLAALFRIPASQISTQGLILCGQPLPGEPGQSDHADEWPEATAVGNLAFQLSFLAHRTARVRRQCAALETFSASIPDWGAHLAVDLLRRSVLASQLHLLRYLPLKVSMPWSLTLDSIIFHCFQSVAALPQSLTPAQKLLISLPVGHGGLGILNLVTETLLYALSHALHLRHLQHLSPHKLGHDQDHLDTCVAKVAQSFSIEQALGTPLHELAMKGKGKGEVDSCLADVSVFFHCTLS